MQFFNHCTRDLAGPKALDLNLLRRRREHLLQVLLDLVGRNRDLQGSAAGASFGYLDFHYFSCGLRGSEGRFAPAKRASIILSGCVRVKLHPAQDSTSLAAICLFGSAEVTNCHV